MNCIKYCRDAEKSTITNVRLQDVISADSFVLRYVGTVVMASILVGTDRKDIYSQQLRGFSFLQTHVGMGFSVP